MTAQQRPASDKTTLGLAVSVALAAAVLSAAAWAKLGALVGVTQTLSVFGVTLALAWLLPVSVDAYAMLTARVWLMSPHATQETRDYARRTALFAIGLSIGGNALYHLIVVLNLTKAGVWPVIVVCVSGIPALQLGLALHLIALVHGDRQRSPQTSAPVDDLPLAGAATNPGVGDVARVPTPGLTPAATSPAAGPSPETAPVPVLEPSPVTTVPVAPDDAPLLPVETSAPVAPVIVPERSGEGAPLPAPVVQTGAPERPRPERTPVRRSGSNRSNNRSGRTGERKPTRAEKLDAAVAEIVAFHNREKRKPSQNELKLRLAGLCPRTDDMKSVYEMANAAIEQGRKTVNG